MPQIVGRIHRVHYTLNSSKHTVDLATRAIAACREDLKGFASPDFVKAVLRDSQQEAIEALRRRLKLQLIAAFGDDVDLSAFTFQVAIAQVDEEGGFFSSFGAVYGTRFNVDRPN
jgi:hypothetical protein